MNKILIFLAGMAVMFAMDISILSRNGALIENLSLTRDSLRDDRSWKCRYRNLYWSCQGENKRFEKEVQRKCVCGE